MMGKVWSRRVFVQKVGGEGFLGVKSGMSLSPITSALLGVSSAYSPVTQCSAAGQDFIL